MTRRRVLSRRPQATTAAMTPTVAGIATNAPAPIAGVRITAPIMRATKQVAARPVRRGTNSATAPAGSSAPMTYMPVVPRPIASNTATSCASAVSLPAAENA
jgi:hypothetical protein